MNLHLRVILPFNTIKKITKLYIAQGEKEYKFGQIYFVMYCTKIFFWYWKLLWQQSQKPRGCYISLRFVVILFSFLQRKIFIFFDLLIFWNFYAILSYRTWRGTCEKICKCPYCLTSNLFQIGILGLGVKKSLLICFISSISEYFLLF